MLYIKYQCGAYVDCIKAQEKLSSYSADFLQTKKYHELGAEFSARRCNVRPKEKGSFGSAACVALDKFRNRTSAPITPLQDTSSSREVR
mgnify:CR=1 FL=1